MGDSQDDEEQAYWKAVEAMADETVQPYRGVLSPSAIEQMRLVLKLTLGAHPNVEPLTRAVVAIEGRRRKN